MLIFIHIFMTSCRDFLIIPYIILLFILLIHSIQENILLCMNLFSTLKTLTKFTVFDIITANFGIMGLILFS